MAFLPLAIEQVADPSRTQSLMFVGRLGLVIVPWALLHLVCLVGWAPTMLFGRGEGRQLIGYVCTSCTHNALHA